MTKLSKHFFMMLASFGVAGVHSLKVLSEDVSDVDEPMPASDPGEYNFRPHFQLQVRIYPLPEPGSRIGVCIIPNGSPEQEWIFHPLGCGESAQNVADVYGYPTNVVEISPGRLHQGEVRNIISDLTALPKFQAEGYDKLLNNSKHFVDAFLVRLNTEMEESNVDAETIEQLQAKRKEVEAACKDFQLQVAIYPCVGERFPHMGVRIVGGESQREWEFGRGLFCRGVFSRDPQSVERLYGAPTKTVDIPTCGMGPGEVERILNDMKFWHEFQGKRYHKLMNNCQDFAYAFVVQLELKARKEQKLDANIIAQLQATREEIEHAKAATASLGNDWLWGGLRALFNCRAECCEDCKKTLWTGFNHTCRACQKKVCSSCCTSGKQGTFRIEVPTMKKKNKASAPSSHVIVVENPKYLCNCCIKKCTEVDPVTWESNSKLALSH